MSGGRKSVKRRKVGLAEEDEGLPSAGGQRAGPVSSMTEEGKKRARLSLLQDSIRPSTQRSYSTSVQQYERLFGKLTENSPVSKETIQDYIIWLVDKDSINGDTLKKYVTAVKTVSTIRSGRVLSAEDEKVVERAVEGGCNRLMHRARSVKKAPALAAEAVAGLVRMTPSKGSRDEEVRDAALTAIMLVLRFESIIKMRRDAIECDLQPGFGLAAREDRAGANEDETGGKERDPVSSTVCLR
ncbi:hypothetical protein FOZ60_004972 [Perkinsus olseni]|uniref:Core-binding (CB) domain-containing protein n=1 Tax=Perkinsus olseni TaxID=32597 RepID=A0A7J6NS62_PEROL|nr:hypothetical protein FOZ60_004972 [Perkinsus olseni]